MSIRQFIRRKSYKLFNPRQKYSPMHSYPTQMSKSWNLRNERQRKTRLQSEKIKNIKIIKTDANKSSRYPGLDLKSQNMTRKMKQNKPLMTPKCTKLAIQDFFIPVMTERMVLVIVTLVDELLPEAALGVDLLVVADHSRSGRDENPSERRFMYSSSLLIES